MEKIIYQETKQLIGIDRVIRDYDFTMPIKHLHNEYELYYLVKGQRYYFIENESYLVEQGSLVIINKNQVHKTATYENPCHDRIVLNFHESIVAELAALANFSTGSFFQNYYGVLPLDKDLQKRVQYLLLQIYKELKNKEAHSSSMVSMYIMEILIHADRLARSMNSLNRGVLAQSEKHKRVNQTATYIQSNYGDKKLSLDSIADSQFISKSYLSRIFKEVTGFTVNEYLHICRVQEAKKLLEQTENSVRAIANKVGFETSSYFERIFKKYTGNTPLKHRKKYKSEES
ncbi:AraC family transcriptional regulator [Konateibacter massiliensis]|uniref:AraC family transcriptional regulator n=1 Tax=Konateibacter massiliensis TaxID=2002841 RepID=UPI0015D47BB7|nr:AraC family transcriptional regulator [Konateibacter massiliensis]